MKNLGRSLTALAAVVSVLGPGGQQSALADDAIIRITGNGTISPGLNTVCTNQTEIFRGTGTIDVGSHFGTYTFTITGAGTGCQTLFTGQGCGTLSGDLTGVICFARNGIVRTVTGNLAYDGANGVIVSSMCVWASTSANPTVTYSEVCTWVLTH